MTVTTMDIIYNLWWLPFVLAAMWLKRRVGI
jgi:hypothetical protein